MINSLAKTIEFVNKKPSYTMDELFDINVAKMVYKKLWNNVWVENDLHFILCPGAQNTAVPHDTFGLPIYTCVWNLLEVCYCEQYLIKNANPLQYPGIIIPFGGKVDRNIDKDHLATLDTFRPCMYACANRVGPY